MKEYEYPPTYRTGDYPTIILITNKRYDWIQEYFQMYSNVIHIQEDTISSRIGYIKRQLLYRFTGRIPRRLEELIYKRLASTGLGLEWWQEKLLKDRAIDAIIIISPAVLPRRVPSRDVKRILWSFDDDVPLFYRVNLALTLHGLIDRVYVTHEDIVEKYRESGSPAKVSFLPYAVPTTFFYPKPEETGLDPKPFFIGIATGGRRVFLRSLNTILEERGLPKVESYTSIQHDYASAIRRMLIAVDVPRRREVNWRVFEVAGAAGLLVTGSKGEIEKLFPGARVYSYRGPILSHNLRMSSQAEITESAREAASRIEEILSDPSGAAGSVEEVCRAAWATHTLHDRVCTILGDLGYKCDPDARARFERVRKEMIRRCSMAREKAQEALEALA